ncbi:glycosyltransferase [Methanolobus sp. WCC5]|uniref:glycosyltransferase n=1 Tax=Methanolobus sp. WCC5 TaxID=3125785 RepID=UPI00324EF1C4
MREKTAQKNLLVICHAYNTFVKDWVDEISVYFDNVYVFVRHNTFFDIFNILKKDSYAHKSLNYKVCSKDKPLNVSIIITPIFYLPISFFFKRAGDKHLSSVIECIEQSKIRFDLVHGHFIWTSGYVVANLKKKYNVPAVVTAHGFDIYDLPFRDRKWTYIVSSIINQVDHIITVSQKNLQKIDSLNINTPTSIVQNGYSPRFFMPMDANYCKNILRLDKSKKILLSVGNLTKVKGHKYLIEAMSILLEKRDDLILIIIGGGPLMKHYENFIKDIGLADSIILVGPKPHNEIPCWMGACDLFVLPSLNEGNPTVMFEALGAGKPFVGTNVGGVPDIIINEKLGILVEPGNACDLANAIIRGLNTKWDLSYIANHSQKYTWSNNILRTMDIYDTLL